MVKTSYIIMCLNAVVGISVRAVSLIVVALILAKSTASQASTIAYFSTVANETMEGNTVNQYEIWQFTLENAAGSQISGPSLDGILSTAGRDFDAVYQDASHWYFSVQAGTTDVDYTGGSLENVNSNKIVRYDKTTGVANIWFDAGTYTGPSQVDAMHIAPNGDLLLSFDDAETFTVGPSSMTLSDGDVIRVPISEAGGVATATAVPTFVLQESVAFQDNEDVEGFSYYNDDLFYVITEGAGQFKTDAMLSFNENDILKYNPTTGVGSVLITADQFDSTNAFNLNALHVVPEPGFYASLVGIVLACFAEVRRRQKT